MCIRDRFQIDAGRVAAALMGDPIAANMFMLGVAWQHGWIPVSYTHLRAHETVLDLVCRLLLEKKNNPERQLLSEDPKATIIIYWHQSNSS